MVMKVGEVYPTENFGDIIITSYSNCDTVGFEFIRTGYRGTDSAGNIRKGLIKDRLQPTRYNVGFLGVGDYTPCVCRKQTPAYQAWNNMMARCYSGLESYKSYREVTVCEDWHNFQNFAEWFEENFIEGWHLDKDIRTDREIKMYSPYTCMFVEPEENIREASAKHYELTAPSGTKYEGWNIQSLCNKFGLDSGSVSKLLAGKVKSHKGWTKPVAERLRECDDSGDPLN